MARIRAACYNGDSTDWKVSNVFSVMDCSVPCPKPFPVEIRPYKDSTGIYSKVAWLNNFGIIHKTNVSIVSDDGSFIKTIITDSEFANIAIPSCKTYKASIQFKCGNVNGIVLDSAEKAVNCFCPKPKNLYFYPFQPDSITYINYDRDYWNPDHPTLLKISSTGGTYKNEILFNKPFNQDNGNWYTVLPNCKKFNASTEYVCSATQHSDTLTNTYSTKNCPPPCIKQTYLTAGIYSDDSIAYVSWYNYAGIKNAKVTITGIDNTFNKTIASNDTFITVSLSKCKKYKATLQYSCGDTVINDPTSVTFSTHGCAPIYCTSPIRQIFFEESLYDTTSVFAWYNDSSVKYKVALVITAFDSSFKQTYYTEDRFLKVHLPCTFYNFSATLLYKCGDNYLKADSQVFQHKYNCAPKPNCDNYQYHSSGLADIYSDDTLAIIKWEKLHASDSAQIKIIGIDTSFYKKFVTKDTAFKISLPPCKNFKFSISYMCDTAFGVPFDLGGFRTGKCDNKCTPPYLNNLVIADSTVIFSYKFRGNLIQNAVLKIHSSTYDKIINTNSDTIKVTLPCGSYTYTLQLKCGTQLSDSASGFIYIYACPPPPPPKCPIPSYFSASPNRNDTTQTNLSYNFGWEPNYNGLVDSSILKITAEDGSFNKTVTLKGYSYQINLKTCTNYTASIKSKCGNRFSDSVSTKFSTFPCNCPAPFGFNYQEGFHPFSDPSYFYYVGLYHQNTYLLKINSTDGSYSKTIAKTDTGFYILIPQLPCKTYTASLQFVCGRSLDSLTKPLFTTFTPRYCDSTYQNCSAVSQVTANTTSNGANINWTNNSNVLVYQLQYHVAGDTIWSNTLTTKSKNYLLTNLKPCITYVARVRTVCDTVQYFNSGTWSETRFKPGTSCVRGDNSGAVSSARATIGVSPNPGSGNPTTVFKLESSGSVRIDVVNIYGSVMERWDAGALQAGEYDYTFKQLGNLPAGLYLIRLHTDGDINRTVKWVKI